jgi:putative ABC transport system permease protein
LAVALALLLLPFFNQISVNELSFDFVERAWLLPLLVLIALIVGLLAGQLSGVVSFFVQAYTGAQR